MTRADQLLNAPMIMEAKAFELTGSVDFAYFWQDGPYWVFSNAPRDTGEGAGRPAHWHGTCLSLASRIYREGYKVSSSTRAGCTGWFGFQAGRNQGGRGHAMDRAQLWKGWLEQPDDLAPGRDGLGTFIQERRGFWITAWTCPVSVCVFQPVKLLRDTVGRPPVRKQVIRAAPGAIIPVQGSTYQIHVHAPTFSRFCAVQAKWRALNAGTSVMCRTTLRRPDELLTCRSKVRNSCGACVDVASPAFSTWTRASETGRYTCPSCIVAMRQLAPRCESNGDWDS